jgi:hypothetical protein
MPPIVPPGHDAPVPTLQQVLDGLDDPGAAACAIRGDHVEEAVAGTTDGTRPWTPDTLVMTYSCAKPFAALTVLAAIRDGALALDDRVSDHWPAYAARGKGGTTVRHLLAHQAGLPSFPPAAAHVAFDDDETLTGLLAEAEPQHEPGAAVAEHALTYGHLLDAVHGAATGAPLADRFTGIARERGWDLHLRVAEQDLPRVADVVPLGDWPAQYLDDPRWAPALGRPPGALDPDVLNSTRFRRTSFPAIALHASARGLARFYAELMDPDGPVTDLLGADLRKAYVSPAASGHDLVLDREVTWTLGLQVDDEELGMGGAGGCAGWWSFTGGYAAGFVTRGLGGHDRGEVVWTHLESGG